MGVEPTETELATRCSRRATLPPNGRGGNRTHVAYATDLQSASFDRSDTLPKNQSEGTRTPNLWIPSPTSYHLHHTLLFATQEEDGNRTRYAKRFGFQDRPSALLVLPLIPRAGLEPATFRF